MNYIDAVITACLFFPIIALIFTIPYIIFNYHKYGSILFVRTLLIYTFILYLLIAYLLVIFPLPPINEVKELHTSYQLVPFHFMQEIILYSGLNIKDSSTYLPFLNKPWVYQALFNIVLTLPFAVFLRYYFNCKFFKTIFYTFMLSLFFELTQLTGLYFIYPNAYRLFDVDDLIVNTIGGIIGYLITPLFIIILPNKDELDSKAYKKGKVVSIYRRITSQLIDIFITISISFIINYLFKYNIYLTFLFSYIIFIIVIPTISKRSIGQNIVNLKINTTSTNKSTFFQILIRNVLFSIYIIPIIIYCYQLFNNIYYTKNKIDSFDLIFSFLVFSIIIMIIFIRNFILKKSFLYENISKTKIISTIKNDF